MLAACSAAAMGALARVWLARGGTRLPTATVLVFWVAFAVGFLIKGPLVLMFAGLCAVVLSIRERSARWLLALRPALGLPLTLLVVAPWFAAIAIKSGGAFFQASVGDDMLGKVATGQQQHGGPPGFYLVAFFATFWPAAAFAALAAPYAWRHRREDGFAFALAWAIPSWLIFEAVPTKLPHYVMPLYPALAIATVIAMARGAIGPRHRGAKAVALLIPLVPLGLTLGLAAAAWRFEGRLPLAGLALLGAATCLAVLAWRAFLRSDIAAAALAGVAAAMLVAVGALGQVQPMLSALKISPRLAAAARSAGCEEPKLGTVGYREPSLVFLTRTDLRDVRERARGRGLRGGRRLPPRLRREPPRGAVSRGAGAAGRRGRARGPRRRVQHQRRPPRRPWRLSREAVMADANGEAGAPRVSFVVPAKNEAPTIKPLLDDIARECAGLAPFEVVYVDDGSTDDTQGRLAAARAARPWLHVLRHAESCGKSAALRTGARAARAPLLVTLDGDGQNDPKFVPAMVSILEAGPGVALVAGQRLRRGDSGFKKLQSRIANGARKALLRTARGTPPAASRPSAATSSSRCPYFDTMHRFFPALVTREGWRVAHVDVVDRPRLAGRSHYGLIDRLWSASRTWPACGG